MNDVERPEPDCITVNLHPRHTRRLFGHEQAQSEFMDAWRSGRLHHAWLISGPRGIGKATMAWRIARFLLTRPQVSAAQESFFQAGSPSRPASPDRIPDPDPSHPADRRMTALSEPDLKLCRRPWDEKIKKFKRFITVDEVRRLQSEFATRSVTGAWRVAIVDAADDMNEASANAFLKLLEEPPDHVLFLLVCHQPSRLLPTVRSRCRTLTCRHLDPDSFAHVMTASGRGENIGARRELAVLSAGSPGDAIRLADGNGISAYADLVRLFSAAPTLDRRFALTIAEDFGSGDGSRFDLGLRLVALLMMRLARFGACRSDDIVEAAEGEAAMIRKLAPEPEAARMWAGLAQDLPPRAEESRRTNLDPTGAILDILFRMNAVARRVVT
ncbi:MAG: DNA polymerase III subunit delta' [Paracoccaceae bacterium]|nr:DNA polymerase III subunit delta' [Paracoccaceae bacterium]